MNKPLNIMVDLETMGNTSNAAIVSIGAAAFDLFTGEVHAEFERVINLNSSSHYGDIDASTVTWWLGQSEEARAIFKKETEKTTLTIALKDFEEWLIELQEDDKPKAQIWGNGSSFDCVILSNAYKAARLRAPFAYWNHRDVRTVVEMGKQIIGVDLKETITREGVHHSALDDAKHQIRYVSLIMRALNNGSTLERSQTNVGSISTKPADLLLRAITWDPAEE